MAKMLFEFPPFPGGCPTSLDEAVLPCPGLAGLGHPKKTSSQGSVPQLLRHGGSCQKPAECLPCDRLGDDMGDRPSVPGSAVRDGPAGIRPRQAQQAGHL